MTREEKRRELRERLGSNLPPELDTDFQMDRWLDSHDENMDKCTVKVLEYLQNRRALNLDTPEALAKFFTRTNTKKYYGIFTQTMPQGDWVNQKDNGIIFVETGCEDPVKAAKLIRTGEFIDTFFGYCEYFQNLVIEQEKKSGKRSFAICIFDMKYMSILQYANPMAPINKIFEARVGVWMDYHGELLKQVVIVNPPKLLAVLLKVMSILLPAKMMDRFHIAINLPSDAEKYISLDALPLGFGGTKMVAGADLPTGCNIPVEYTKDDYAKDGQVWTNFAITKVPYESHSVNVGDSFVKELVAKKGQTFVFEYLANRNFEITLIKDGNEYLLPRFRMSTPLLAEEGSVPIKEDGALRMEIKNLSNFMKMKLKIAVLLVD